MPGKVTFNKHWAWFKLMYRKWIKVLVDQNVKLELSFIVTNLVDKLSFSPQLWKIDKFEEGPHFLNGLCNKLHCRTNTAMRNDLRN